MDAILMEIGLPLFLGSIFAFVLGICLTVMIYQMIAKKGAKTFKELGIKQSHKTVKRES